MVNNRIKEHLLRAYYDEMGKGHFYARKTLGALEDANTIKEMGLRVVNGFKFSLQCLAPKRIYLQIDKSTRVLRTKNLWEEIRSMQGGPQ